ncbi:regulator of chromosome condensation rcc1 [Diaporthe amygdali]|uniref:regulator of chromosome condensation rcc1 n=1 Tax=Phomopsis amygdali TaxID=1214568 RepID=UPI0022FEECC5|nr:regulator of chromosome condensation rcc1 [Diaporthe amygdali]KAJ0123270.1 regulator of chromosome condensation rcc1 [Diaporthe amygdali]
MDDKISSLTDLPLDILVLIFPYLDPKSFLALCSTCKALQQPSICLDPTYWRLATRSTFRVPNQPVVANDGTRWQKMYRRLLTQSRVFTWGSNGSTRLGHSYAADTHSLGMPPIVRRGLSDRLRRQNRGTCGFPTEMEDTRSLGVIADMQCGGWSTTLLTSEGSLYTAGVLNGQRFMHSPDGLQKLSFPAGPGPTSSSAETQQNESITAIRQFSAGRSHILALSDSGRIWSWQDAKQPALHVNFAGLGINELSPACLDHPSSGYGLVKQVNAGWSRSSAYVQGVGIVVWDPIEPQPPHADDETHTVLVSQYAEVPKTGYKRVKDTHGESEFEKALGAAVGSLLNYIILEHFVVFVTDIGKVFCARFGENNSVDDVLELQQLRNEKGSPLDVQGSFRRFAVFRNNEVITTDQEYLEACWNARHTDPEQADIRGLRKIAALQHNDIIQIAFGDYHFLALHSNGKITSYGAEPNACGALGLGDETSMAGHSRGVVYEGFSRQGKLLPHAYTHGRQVWFDERKKDWLYHIVYGRLDPDESQERRALFKHDRNVQGEVSEWIEQEARAWDQGEEEDGLGAYFALGVSAAGWHSGALVLVNDELVNKEPVYPWEQKNFPRLRLADGTEMPGQRKFDEWREGRPDWQLDAQPWP